MKGVFGNPNGELEEILLCDENMRGRFVGGEESESEDVLNEDEDKGRGL